MRNNDLTTVYKLTRPDQTTHENFFYLRGQLYTFSGTGPLCGPGYSHAYLSMATAVFHNPIHAAYDPAILWRAEGIIAAQDSALKVGCSAIRLLEPCALPSVTMEQRVAYAIRLAWPHGSPRWRQWAKKWLNGQDRSVESATTLLGKRATAPTLICLTAWAAESIVVKSPMGPIWVGWVAEAVRDLVPKGVATMLESAEWALTATDPFQWKE